MTSFRYDKENLFKEFKIAKEKDEKNKKITYDNRIQFFRDHITLKKKSPEIYEFVDVNFEKLLEMWLAPNPRDAFYMKFFGMTYAQKKAQEEAEFSEQPKIKKVDVENATTIQ